MLENDAVDAPDAAFSRPHYTSDALALQACAPLAAFVAAGFAGFGTFNASLLLGAAALLCLYQFCTLPRFYSLDGGKLVIKAAAARFVLEPANIAYVRPASALDLYLFVGLRIVAASEHLVEICMVRGPNWLIAPRNPEFRDALEAAVLRARRRGV